MLAVGMVAFALAAPPGAQAESGPAANTFAVRDVRIFDGVHTIGTGSVLVVGGRIAAVGLFALPYGIPVYDGHGRTLVPGLIDASAHTLVQVTSDPGGPPSSGGSAADRNDAARFGVTTEIDTFGDPALIAGARQQRRSVARTGEADLWSAGIGVTVPNGFPPDGTIGHPFPRLAPNDDPSQFVADRLAEGSDFTSLVIDDGSLFFEPAPTLTAQQAGDVVSAAHEHGRLAVAISPELVTTTTAVRAGVDGLNHLVFDQVVGSDLVRQMRQHGTFVTTTLATFDCGTGADQLLANPLVRPLLSNFQVQALNLRFPNCPASWLTVGLRNIALLHAAGVPIVAGTDAGGGVAAHGASMFPELADLVLAGLTPAQALTAATATPAHDFRIPDRGRIAPGMRADLLLVNGDPTTDINALPDIAQVWKNGFPVDRTPQQ